MKTEGSTGVYVGATGPIDLPRPKRRKHRPAGQRHVCGACDLPIVRPGAFHVCLDLSKPEPVVAKVVKAKKEPKPKKEAVAPKRVMRPKSEQIRDVLRSQMTPDEVERARARDRRKRKGGICGCGAIITLTAKTCAKCMGLKKRKLTDAQEADIAAAYKAGATAASLSREYGVTDTVIKYALNRQGVQTRGQGKRPPIKGAAA